MATNAKISIEKISIEKKVRSTSVDYTIEYSGYMDEIKPLPGYEYLEGQSHEVFYAKISINTDQVDEEDYEDVLDAIEACETVKELIKACEYHMIDTSGFNDQRHLFVEIE